MLDKRFIDIQENQLGIGANGCLMLETVGRAVGAQLPVAPGNTPHLGGKQIPSEFTAAAAAGAANVANVTFQLSDTGGVAVGSLPMIFDLWLSDNQFGVGQTATTASGGIAAIASDGTIWQTITASKAIRAQPNAAGLFGLAITDTAKTNFFVCAQNPMTGLITVLKLATSNYG